MTIAGLCATLLLLPACSSDPTPRFAPSDPAPTSPGTPLATTPGTTIGPPALPQAARDHTKAGAIAFVKYYWNVANYAQHTLDLTPLASLADRHCQGCANDITWLRKVRVHGGQIRGGDSTPSQLIAQTLASADHRPWMNVRLHLTATPQVVAYPDGKGNERYRGGHTSALMVLHPVHTGWLVDLLEIKQ